MTEKKDYLVKLIIFLTGSISVFLFLDANFFYMPESCIWMLIFECIFLGVYCLKYLKETIAMFFFYLSMFTFLTGTIIIAYFSNTENWMLGFTLHEFITSCNALYLSYFFIFVGYCIAKKKRKNREYVHIALGKIMSDQDDYKIEKIQMCAFIIFLIAVLLNIISEIPNVLAARSLGYMALYDGTYSRSSLNSISKLICRTSLFIGLAAKPNKRRVYVYFFLGAIPPLLELIEGTRTAALSFALFYAFYWYISRNVHHVKRKSWTYFFALGIIAIIILPFMYRYGHTRTGLSYDESSTILGGVKSFFEESGRSFQMIGYAVRYKGLLPGLCYSFGTIIDIIQGNPYSGSTVASALEANQFGNIITYLVTPTQYLKGYGLGSSFVAELFYDFGYFGVCIGSFVIGIVLRNLVKINDLNTFTKSILFILYFNMLTMPRASLMRPITYFISSSLIMTFILIFFIGYTNLHIRIRKRCSG